MPHELQHLLPDDVVLDALPEAVEASIQVRDRWFADSGFSQGSGGLEFIVGDLTRWMPGQTLRVAFLGGTSVLHREIAEATQDITGACNIELDYGEDSATGKFRTWSEQDTILAAEIRVSFDQAGYFSLVGTDSVNPLIGAPMGAVGGRPGQRSLNLGGFTLQKPADWRGTVRHEFLHALSFHHSHQNMRGHCEQEFRWEDDPGYQPTQDAQGRYIKDSGGQQPGVYTYLSGYPNFWGRQKVDHNLRTEENHGVVAGPFDRASVMLYRFPPLFYKTENSNCAPTGDGIALSDGDERALKLLYPHMALQRAEVVERRDALLAELEGESPAALNVLKPIKGAGRRMRVGRLLS